ncbi:MAG: MotA/TolQ/ExbB proton channel family protein [Colwellia sp.]|nr:MotA/TolQ/ExbB proton channel family protein [Colwellia sp.]
MSIIALALIIEKCICYAMAIYRYQSARKNADNLVTQLNKHNKQAGQAQAYTELWLQDLQTKWLKRLPLLSLIGSLAPMVGLLGTVWGLVVMFRNLAASQQAVTPALLADGLWQAMYSTMAGLCLALPCLLVSGVFTSVHGRLTNSYVQLYNQAHYQLTYQETFNVTST